MPSFSPRAKRITFSRYAPNRGVWVMSSEGREKELVLIDESGWGADWSPDGKQIAFTTGTGRGTNIVIFDLVEGDRRFLFNEKNPPYSAIYWNFAWSPDSKGIVFKGTRQGGKSEVGLVDVRGGLVTLLAEDVTPTFAWTPDSKQILGVKMDRRRKRHQIFSLTIANNNDFRLLPGQNVLRNNTSVACSPDGKQIAFSSRKANSSK